MLRAVRCCCAAPRGRSWRRDSLSTAARIAAGRRGLSAYPGAAGPEPSLRLAVSHCATSKERRDGTIARRSEDAFLFSAFALGICDGVGGWEARGIDSGAYSRGLCEGAARALHDAAVEARLESLLPKPLLLLQAGYRHACDQSLMGSSTALVRMAVHCTSSRFQLFHTS
jgi:serine/threonine protein phosphatase PrpC